MNLILAIDPGPTKSAFVMFNPEDRTVGPHGKVDNAQMQRIIKDPVGQCGARACWCKWCVIERVASYGKPVGQEVFDCVWWSGRFAELWNTVSNTMNESAMMFRRVVKMHLCHTMNGVNDGVIRQRILDIFGPGRELAIGTKAKPGPLHGIKADEWQALALALVYAETNGAKP
jgi:hypothetical protein